MRVMVCVERRSTKGEWVQYGQPSEGDSRRLAVFLPPGRVRVRFTTPDGRERMSDEINNARPRWVRPGRGH